MRVAAAVTEYNPFHNGHKYHMAKTLEETGCDHMICIMSGDFVQRGEPAIHSKWIRAKAAVSEGVNLVLELPAVYALSSAESFASGAVSILDSLGVVDFLSFGSESGDIGRLSLLAELLTEEPEQYKIKLKESLSLGHSYPAARQIAAAKIDSGLSELLKGSNNVLAVEYMKACGRLGTRMRPVTIPRMGSDYKSTQTEGKLSSATSIRESIHAGKDISEFVPAEALNIIKNASVRHPDDFSGIILYLLRTAEAGTLNKIDYMNDGLGNIFKKNIFRVNDTKELIKASDTRRHTETRLRRALFNMLLGITKEYRTGILNVPRQYYARVLAFDAKGALILSGIRKRGGAVIITKAAGYKKILDTENAAMFELDLRASDIYNTVKNTGFIPDIAVSPFRLQ